jgi:hypothetical protein
MGVFHLEGESSKSLGFSSTVLKLSLCYSCLLSSYFSPSSPLAQYCNKKSENLQGNYGSIVVWGHSLIEALRTLLDLISFGRSSKGEE